MQIKEDISDSTRKLLDNQVNLEGLHKKAEDMKGSWFEMQRMRRFSRLVRRQWRGRCGVATAR
jgi:hypothetical protein